MSTNKTTNYQLHLWEPGDDFLREEFNENNVKVDTVIHSETAALYALLPQIKLFEVTTTAASAQISLDVSSINWDDWDHIMVRAWFRAPDDYVFTTSKYTLLRINSDSSENYNMGDTYIFRLDGLNSGTKFHGRSEFLLWPLADTSLAALLTSAHLTYNTKVYADYCRSGTLGGYTTSAAIKTIDFVANGFDTYAAGSHFEVWGVR